MEHLPILSLEFSFCTDLLVDKAYKLCLFILYFLWYKLYPYIWYPDQVSFNCYELECSLRIALSNSAKPAAKLGRDFLAKVLLKSDGSSLVLFQ